MKKLLLLIMVMLCTSTIYSQEEKETTSKSKSVEFLAKGGSLISKEFYDIKKVKGVNCQVLILTDIVANKKMGCLRLETSYTSRVSTDTYVGTLDEDEIDACIKSLEYISSTILPSTPETYTEIQYNSRDGVKFGAYSKKDKWSTFVYTKSYTSRSAEFFDSSNLSELINTLKQAKEMIEGKIK